MSDTTDTPAPDTDTAEKRERRTFPIRLLAQSDAGTWHVVPAFEPVNTIDAAEKWISSLGVPGTAYMMARIIGAKRRPPTKLEDVAI